MKHDLLLFRVVFLACFILIPCELSAQGATITYVGSQMDIESDADTPENGWRNTTPAKPLDIDGDNILGTDGWFLDRTKSVPSYVSSIKPGANVNGIPAWGVLDNPSDPSGKDNIIVSAFHDTTAGLGETTGPLIQWVIKGNHLNGKTLRLGVLSDVVDAGTATYTLEQTVGGSASATTPALAYNGDSLDVAFFDVTGALDGDTFVITSTTLTGGIKAGFEQVVGITFDTGKSTFIGGGVAKTNSGEGSYADWINGFSGLNGLKAFNDDADSDGIKNGVENYFGTHPGESSQGLSLVNLTGDTFVFTHPLNKAPVSDVSAEYRWSKDGKNFYADGESHQGTAVSFSQGVASGGTVTVTGTITGSEVEQLSVDVKVTQN